MKEINLIKIKKPTGNDPSRNIIWLCETLGLISKRDKERNAFRIFSEIVKANREKKYLTSEDVGKTLKISRTNAIHHLNKLINFLMIFIIRKWNGFLIAKPATSDPSSFLMTR